MLGYSKEFLEARYDEIVEFSELGSFIDVPVKNYSSGMRARLGFSVATIVEPDILILDEVLSVGDAKFRKNVKNRIQSMFDKGVTVIFVSHSTSQVLRMCQQGHSFGTGPSDCTGGRRGRSKCVRSKDE